MKNAKMTTFTTSIQYCTRSSSYCSKAKVGIKGGKNKERKEEEVGERDKGKNFVKEGHKDQKGRSKTSLYLQIP